MAIKDPCEHCGQLLSVPDGMRGRKVRCPACGRRSTVLTVEDRQAVERQQQEAERLRERLALLERIEQDRNLGQDKDESPMPAIVTATVPSSGDTERNLEPVVAPVAMEAAPEPVPEEPIRDLSDLVLFFAYLLPLLALASGLLPLVVGGSLGFKLAAIGGALVVGGLSFIGLKWLSEFSRFLADDREFRRYTTWMPRGPVAGGTTSPPSPTPPLAQIASDPGTPVPLADTAERLKVSRVDTRELMDDA